MDGVPGIDKLAHVIMYFGTCSIMWWEYLRCHSTLSMRKAVLWIVVLPTLMSALIELLQEYATSHRGGDWIDLAANTTGVLLAALLGRYVIRPFLKRRKSDAVESE